MHIPRKIWVLIILAGILFLVGISYIVYFEEGGNFHTITPHEAYRSGEMDSDELEYYIKKYDIKSILNLRSDEPNAAWFRDERRICVEHNLTCYYITLSVTNEPSKADLDKIVGVFHSAPRPILIHCKQGADRTSFVAAMWKVIVDKESKAEAKKQFSFIYFHLPIGRVAVLDHFFKKWQPE